MSLRTIPGPCWSLTHEHDGEHERIAHYPTREDAAWALFALRHEALTVARMSLRSRRPTTAEVARDRATERTSRPQQATYQCVWVICDACGCGLDMDGDEAEPSRAMHTHPDEVDDWLDTCEWSTDDRGHHQCGGCGPLGPLTDCEHDVDGWRHPYCPCRTGDDLVAHADPDRTPGPADVALPGLGVL